MNYEKMFSIFQIFYTKIPLYFIFCSKIRKRIKIRKNKNTPFWVKYAKLCTRKTGIWYFIKFQMDKIYKIMKRLEEKHLIIDLLFASRTVAYFHIMLIYKKFQKMLKICGMVSSMSRKGNCWDNAVAESFFGSLKTERVFFTNYTTREEARRDVVDYIEMFYNCNRRHSYLRYMSPREFEKLWFLKKAA